MLSKKNYFIHFTHIFFASLSFAFCSLFSHLWNVYQPFQLALQFEQCQIILSNNQTSQINFLPSFSIFFSSCQFYIKNDYPLNISKFFELIHSIIFIYLLYRFLCLSFFHGKFQYIQSKQKFYAHLYCQNEKHQKSRCSNRLL